MILEVTSKYSGVVIGATTMVQALCNAGGAIVGVNDTFFHGKTTSYSVGLPSSIHKYALGGCMYLQYLYCMNTAKLYCMP